MVIRGPRCRALKFLSRSELASIHNASLEILESTGMHSESELILKVFNDAGADVDFKEKRVRIPSYLIEEGLRKSKKQFILHGRNPKYSILIENGRVYFGMGGTPVPYVRDWRTGEFRRPGKADVEEMARLGNALRNMSFIMNIAGAFDVPYEVEYIHEFEALFNNTEKPIIYSAPFANCARYVIRMASEIVGGEDNLRRKPIFSIYSETVSPLKFTLENENMIECAKAGIPVTLGPATILGATGPITPAGAVAVSNAEALASITLIQLVNPNSPVIYAAWGVVMDQKTGTATYASPENALTFGVLNGQLAEFYNLPCFGLGGAIDSKTPDAQAGCEATMLLLVSALVGVTLIHDCGYLASGGAGSLEMAVICDEIVENVLNIIKGVAVNDETLAIDVIKNVGPHGHFFSQKHTLKHLRELYTAQLFDKSKLETWVRRGRKDIGERAREAVEKILAEHKPTPLPSDVKRKIEEIVREAEREMVKSSKYVK
jgi:trimethylamine--corrinoid protein Co-methyltransferase